MSQLVILSGLPRSGKSSLSKKYKDQGFKVIELDQYRLDVYFEEYNEDLEPSVWDIARDDAIEALNSDQNVLIDESNINILNISYWIKGIPEDTKIRIILVNTSEEICLSRTDKDYLKSAISRKFKNKSTAEQVEELADRIGAEVEVVSGA